MKVRFLKYILTFLSLVVLAFNAEAKQFVVVIDPGHGGKDYGAIGAGTNEKTIH
ncbi:MAG: N-acetylmuramoyl-L-alanine amidase, partial [Muribaculaceae bacterium]|nr:N-acetylmuramoyl-L-alanine amidase [Muribaculaceae bacterium]